MLLGFLDDVSIPAPSCILITSVPIVLHKYYYCFTQGRRKIDNWGGPIFIYSCSAQLISFEIVI